MKYKKIIAGIAALSLLLGLSACKSGGDTETTGESTTAESTTSDETTTEEPTTAEETTAPEKKFVFDEKKAAYIGEFSSEIYGKLFLYFQDDRIAIKDEFKEIKFVLDAEGYSPAASSEGGIQLIAEDMNFDGYTDFRLPSSVGNVNSFYYCWLWDMNARTFKYYYPLSAISSPVFNKDTKEVVSTNRSSATHYDVSTYTWIDGQLTIQKHESVTETEDATVGSEVAENNTVEITEGLTAFITLYGNPGSQCRWFPIVEDEDIVEVYSQTYEDSTAQTKICFQAHGIGTTTVVIRFALDRNSDYVSEKIFNITADDDFNITIKEIQ